jgi:hypothetical protein
MQVCKNMVYFIHFQTQRKSQRKKMYLENLKKTKVKTR